MNNPLFWAHHIEYNFLRELSVLRIAIRDRLLPTFDNIDEEADQIADEIWHGFNASCNPEADPGDMAEEARDSGIDHYLMMVDVRQAITNLFAVALHHMIEQQQLFILRKGLLPPENENDRRFITIPEFVERLAAVGIG